MNGREIGEQRARSDDRPYRGDGQTRSSLRNEGTLTRPEIMQADMGDGDPASGISLLASPLLAVDNRRADPVVVPGIEIPLADFQLPGPAIPSITNTNHRPPSARDIHNMDRRVSALTSPRITPGSPRTRFDLTKSPTIPPSSPAYGLPLPSILNSPVTPNMYPRVDELDITEQQRYTSDDLSPPNSPVFLPRDDDEPHPERTIGQDRTPHPMYTPASNPRIHRRRRRKAMSVTSGRNTIKSARTRIKSVWRVLRKRGKRPTRSNASSSGASSSSVSSTDSSSSSTRSGRSNSTWGGWRFWRNSSSGSSSGGSDSDEDEDWIPPTPHFTLMTPCLKRPSSHPTYPDHLLPRGLPSGTGVEGGQEETSTPRIFDLASSSTLAATLERLQAFWSERRQEDGLAGDLGAGVGGAALGGDQEEISYFPERGRGSGLERETSPSTPIATPSGLGGGRKLRGEEKAARAEEKRMGKGGVQEDTPAWWLDVMCPTVADMRELRKVGTAFWIPIHELLTDYFDSFRFFPFIPSRWKISCIRKLERRWNLSTLWDTTWWSSEHSTSLTSDIHLHKPLRTARTKHMTLVVVRIIRKLLG